MLDQTGNIQSSFQSTEQEIKVQELVLLKQKIFYASVTMLNGQDAYIL